ncbi:MAG: hypoxanthine phosphoribosyltransferase [Desulfurivibrionaceae bacterium]|nr:hypoxanthine phosphoribosyltransferase [Desulfobulbales bacterium]MDT8334274.1 hypoxanthine phosphoribosyltransferase [Desulfurivibrionaceae bacterium]
MEKELVISSSEIARRVRELGREISKRSRDRLLVVGVLKGAFVFTADLVRAISIPLELDFIRVASYGADSCSSGEIRLSGDLQAAVAGRDVLLVEDIVDTGTTLVWLLDYLRAGGAGSVTVCALIDKRQRRREEVIIDYCGFRREGFLVGYGLDYGERYRELPDIYELKSA